MSTRPILVMGGRAYADIDVLACASAYKQYLALQGHIAYAVITGPWNQTVPLSVKNWQIEIEKKLPCESKAYHFVLVDFSDPQYVDQFVDLDAVLEVFDHHYGYEDYWRKKIGPKAFIEKVGACATLIWEKFKAAGLENQISTVNANLLYTAIMANTLDFKSAVTQERDKLAAKELMLYTQLPVDWKDQYYAEVETEFLKNAIQNILEDTKTLTLFDINVHFGQIELQNARSFLETAGLSLKELEEGKDGETRPWIINIVSIEESCSYLYCNCEPLLEQLKTFTSAKMISMAVGPLFVTSRLWLRKEILKEMMILQETQKKPLNFLVESIHRRIAIIDSISSN